MKTPTAKVDAKQAGAGKQEVGKKGGEKEVSKSASKPQQQQQQPQKNKEGPQSEQKPKKGKQEEHKSPKQQQEQQKQAPASASKVASGGAGESAKKLPKKRTFGNGMEVEYLAMGQPSAKAARAGAKVRGGGMGWNDRISLLQRRRTFPSCFAVQCTECTHMHTRMRSP